MLQVVRLKAPILEGEPKVEDFEVVGVDVDTSAVPESGILFRPLVFSADPYLRSRFKTTRGVITGFVAGRVEASKNARFPVQSLWGLVLPFQSLQIVAEEALSGPTTVAWDLTPYLTEENISLGVGALGMPGATAWGGLFDVLKPKKGEVLFVSAATGAVGSLVAQMASRVVGCTVIGSCGGPEKGKLAQSLGCEHVIDYRTLHSTEEFVAAIRKASPNGVDMNFENVGGMTFDAVFQCLRAGGRAAICGAISQYNASGAGEAPNQINIASMIYTCQRIQVSFSLFFLHFFCSNSAMIRDFSPVPI